MALILIVDTGAVVMATLVGAATATQMAMVALLMAMEAVAASVEELVVTKCPISVPT